MRTTIKILAATMFLLAAWTVFSPMGGQSAMAYPPNPCLQSPDDEFCQ